MKTYILYNSEKKNRYLFDKNKKSNLLCHPLMELLLQLDENDRDIEKWMNELIEPNIKIKGAGSFSIEEIKYYYKKYQMLKENGYFSKKASNIRCNTKITSDHIKTSLANTKQITFEVTDRCNLNCEYCGYGKYYGNFDNRVSKELNIKSAKNLLNFYMELSNSTLNRSHDSEFDIGFYGGEPLMNFSFIKEIVDYASQMKFIHNKITFSMTTNALLLEKHMDFLEKHKFNILISLDGNKENNSYRVLHNGKNSFDLVIKNIKALEKKHPHYFKNKVEFNAVVHNRNSVEAIHKYIKGTFHKIPKVSELNMLGIRESMRAEFKKVYSKVIDSFKKSNNCATLMQDMFILLPHISNLNSFIKENNLFCCDTYSDFEYDRKSRKKMPTGTCVPFAKKIFMTVNGKVLPCETIGFEHALGDITEDKVDIDFEEISKKFNGYFQKLKKQCDVCHDQENCQLCIFYINIKDRKPKCDSFMSSKDLQRYFSNKISYLEKKPGNYIKIIKEVSLA